MIDAEFEFVLDFGYLVVFDRVLDCIEALFDEQRLVPVGTLRIFACGWRADSTTYPNHRLSVFLTLMIACFLARNSGSSWYFRPLSGMDCEKEDGGWARFGIKLDKPQESNRMNLFQEGTLSLQTRRKNNIEAEEEPFIFIIHINHESRCDKCCEPIGLRKDLLELFSAEAAFSLQLAKIKIFLNNKGSKCLNFFKFLEHWKNKTFFRILNINKF